MTKEEALSKLETIKVDKKYDDEIAHIHADTVLTDFLVSLGYQDVVDAYEKITPKWYA